MATVADIRAWAMALPEVEESTHFKFRTPVFKVKGKPFVGIGRAETTAVFCISEEQSDAAAKADPTTCESVRRKDARRSFLGLQADLNGVPAEQLKGLVLDAWREKAPKRLAREHDPSQ